MANSLRAKTESLNHRARGLYLTLALAASSCVLGYVAWGLPEGSGEPGPGFLPLIVTGTLLALTAAVALRDIFAASREADTSEITPEPMRWRHAALALIVLVYIGILPHIGFLAGTFVLLMLLSKLFSVKGIVKPIFYSLITTGLVYVAFVELLKVPLSSI